MAIACAEEARFSETTVVDDVAIGTDGPGHIGYTGVSGSSSKTNFLGQQPGAHGDGYIICRNKTIKRPLYPCGVIGTGSRRVVSDGSPEGFAR